MTNKTRVILFTIAFLLTINLITAVWYAPYYQWWFNLSFIVWACYCSTIYVIGKNQ